MPEASQCPECKRLWSEYASAALDYISLDRHYYFASLDHTHPNALKTLKTELDATSVAKEALREAIRRHEQTHRNADAATA